MGDLNAGLLAGTNTVASAQHLAGVRSGPAQATTAQGAAFAAASVGVTLEEVCHWNEQQVAAWVGSLRNLGPFAPLFAQHQIDGALLLRVDEGMLREMGVNLIGPRARLLDELSRLKAAARRARREGVIWQADQFDGRSCWTKFLKCNVCAPIQLDNYRLTNSYLVVKRTREPMCGPIHCGSCCGVDTKSNSMDLSLVRDVDMDSHSQGCFCCASSHDEIRVSTEGPLAEDTEILHVDYLHGAEIMGMLRNAMEENQIQAAVMIR